MTAIRFSFSLILILAIIGVLVWWFTSDNATAPVVDGRVQYNRDASGFARLVFRLDCAVIRGGSFNEQSVECIAEE
jgi:hypothetical protein